MAITTDLELFSDTGFTFDPDTFGPAGVRGVNKVAQRYIYALMTRSGTVPGRPNDGCDFLDLVSQFRSEFDLFAAFAAAESAASATVRATELSSDPLSERLGAARLVGVTVSGDGVTMSVQVAARDGSTPDRPIDFTLDL